MDEHENPEDEDVTISFGKGQCTKTLVFVYQTEDQRNLFERYDNKLCLLDAPHKTTRYALPVFFIAVRENKC